MFFFERNRDEKEAVKQAELLLKNNSSESKAQPSVAANIGLSLNLEHRRRDLMKGLGYFGFITGSLFLVHAGSSILSEYERIETQVDQSYNRAYSRTTIRNMEDLLSLNGALPLGYPEVSPLRYSQVKQARQDLVDLAIKRSERKLNLNVLEGLIGLSIIGTTGGYLAGFRFDPDRGAFYRQKPKSEASHGDEDDGDGLKLKR